MIDQIGTACDESDYAARRCKVSAPVYAKRGTASCHLTTKMAIDADGAPKAYFPGERYPSNVHGAFDWLDNLNPSDIHGIQGQGEAVGPAPDFAISGISLTDGRFPENDTRRYVDASVVPYVVLTGASFSVPSGMRLVGGALAFVVDTRTGISSGAIYADVGRAVGEASLALSLMLGVNPFSRRYFPKVSGGVSNRRIFNLVFPSTVIPPPWDVPTIQARAKRLRSLGRRAAAAAVVSGDASYDRTEARDYQTAECAADRLRARGRGRNQKFQGRGRSETWSVEQPFRLGRAAHSCHRPSRRHIDVRAPSCPEGRTRYSGQNHSLLVAVVSSPSRSGPTPTDDAI